jgi:hypothetical protein
MPLTADSRQQRADGRQQTADRRHILGKGGPHDGVVDLRAGKDLHHADIVIGYFGAYLCACTRARGTQNLVKQARSTRHARETR